MKYFSSTGSWFILARLAFLGFVLSGFIFNDICAQQVQIQLSKKQVVVGEPFEIRVVVTNMSSGEVQFPKMKQKEILKQWQQDSTDNQGNDIAIGIYQCMVLQPGEFRVPAQDISVKKNSISRILKTPSVSVYIELLSVSQPDLRAEPLASISYSTNEWLPYALGLVVVLFIGTGYMVYRNQAVFKRTRKLNPKKQALARLKEVKDNGISPLDKLYALQLNYILREYLTTRFGISAFYMTVEQITEAFSQYGMSSESTATLENMLEQLQYLMFHPATDAKSRPNTLVAEMQQMIETLDKKSLHYSTT